ncbi:MAG TPA: endonuclease III [Alphaproteobacteria bacterium]|nr:endonuclease III [Alphaproteobacteria bacterium]
MKKQDVVKVFDIFHSLNPEPKGELDSTNTYTLLVAVALSAQATDVGVNKATESLFKVVSTPYDMIDLGEERLIEYIKSIGLYKTKAKNIMLMAQQLIDLHNGEVPNDQKALEALGGVGRKTANVVRNIAFGEPTIAVDTHLFRVSNRTGMAPGKKPLQVEKALAKVIPKKYIIPSHHWLILHGRYICKARKPECDKCPISKYCDYYKEKEAKLDFSD